MGAQNFGVLLLALLAFDILIFTIANAILIMEIKTNDDINRLFGVGAVVCIVSLGLSAFARSSLGQGSLEWSLGGNGYMSAALLGPASVFFVLKDTRASESVKWAFFSFLIFSALMVQFFAAELRA